MSYEKHIDNLNDLITLCDERYEKAIDAAIALMRERDEFIKANSDLIGDGRFQLRPYDCDLVNKVMIIRQSAARRSRSVT